MKKLLALVTLVGLISFGSAAYGVGVTEDQRETLEVNNWKGQHVGTAKYVVVNPSTGDITFVILYLDQEVKREIAVPLAAFSSFDTKNRVLTLNVSEKELGLAPEFHDADLDNPAFAERVYRFFGLVPSWTDGTKDRESRM